MPVTSRGIRPLARYISSERFTVVLLAFAMALVFFGTLDQARYGVRAAEKMYFESFLAFWKYPEPWPGGSVLGTAGLPLPGGYLLGSLLLLNLLAAFFRCFRLSWSRAGFLMVHAGIALMLAGQLLTNFLREESYMWLEEGERSSCIVSFHENELAITDKSNPAKDAVISVPGKMLERGEPIEHPRLPFRIKVAVYYPNARISRNAAVGGPPHRPVTRGIGHSLGLTAAAAPPVYKNDGENVPAAVVELASEGTTLGTWLVSGIFDERYPAQMVSCRGRAYEIALRPRREYLPYSIELLDFTHERYPGTGIPRNFSSKIYLRNPVKNEERQALISMNRPLRYEGLIYYQSSYGKDDTASMLQVVRNPVRLTPYISCSLIFLGLAWHLGLKICRHIRSRSL